jgi:hypothetical protein
MKIKSNSTKYDSKRLKQIFSECYNIVKKKEGKLWRWKGLNVEIKYMKGYLRSYKDNCYSGWAYYDHQWGGTDMLLRLTQNMDIKNISQLFSHELYHCYGFKHGQFRRRPLDDIDIDKIRDRFKGISLLAKEKPKVKIDYVLLRKTRAEQNLTKWLSKYNFAKNKVKKYQRQVKYYNK